MMTTAVAQLWDMSPRFADAACLDWLEAATEHELDQLPYGVIALDDDGFVVHYNSTEARNSGLTASRVIGRHFFTSVAPCTNNHLIAGRFANEKYLDDAFDYVFTLHMKPTKVRLRLLKHPDARCMYVLVDRRVSNG